MIKNIFVEISRAVVICSHQIIVLSKIEEKGLGVRSPDHDKAFLIIENIAKITKYTKIDGLGPIGHFFLSSVFFTSRFQGSGKNSDSKSYSGIGVVGRTSCCCEVEGMFIALIFSCQSAKKEKLGPCHI